MLYIFDWDGTVIDSTAKIVRCLQMAIAEHDMPERTDEQAKSIIGLGLPEAVQDLYPTISPLQNQQLRESYSRHFIEADQTPCNFYPDVERVMQQLRSDGHSLAVATGKSRRGLDRVLVSVGMEGYFDATRCADETASKPDPLMLLQLLKQLEFTREDAVMVGDTEYDLGMANNAGMKSIAVTYGAHSKERLLKCRPERLIDSFAELLGGGGVF